MTNWRHVLNQMANDVDNYFDQLKNRMDELVRGREPIVILPYRGYGTSQRLYLKGRVLEKKDIPPVTDRDTVWNNLINMYKRMESDEVPFARLIARFQGQEWETTADEEGFFEFEVQLPAPLPADKSWHSVELELLAPRSIQQINPVKAEGRVFVPPTTARFGVISDIDDTVLKTDATHWIRTVRNVFLGNARTRLPFPGVAAFYRALSAGPDEKAAQNPLFYVSSSPWNLYDLLSEFFNLNDIPVGPLFLRDWGISEEEILPLGHRRYKLGTIRKILDLYDPLPFILIGDSGQEDPEIYTEVVARYRSRILASYIRNVTHDPHRPEAIEALADKVLQAGSTLILADNTLALARHAVQQGWIAAASLEDIAGDKAKDEAPPNPIETLLGTEEKPAGPTVVIESPTAETPPAGLPTGTLESALKAGKEAGTEPPTVVVQPEPKPESE